jgi:4-amino-4-deoxychorismate lyase
MHGQFLINGRKDACLTPLDRGFSYGDGVFRTFRVRHRVPECWERHYRKLSDDCNVLGIVCPAAETLLSDVQKLCSQDEECVVKIIVTRGESVRGYAVPPLAQPNRAVIKSPFPEYPAHYFSEGVTLHACNLRLSLQPRLAGIKHLNRLENVLARMEWVDGQIADGLLLDVDGYVIECTMSNLFMRSEDLLVTPDLSRCGVSGVTRERIMEISGDLGYRVEVARFGMEELLKAEELIVCNSLYGAWQVRVLGGTAWPAGNLAARVREALGKNDAPVA